MLGIQRAKKSFPITLGNEEGHEGTEANPQLLEFPPLDFCREPLFRRRLDGENKEENICVIAQQNEHKKYSFYSALPPNL